MTAVLFSHTRALYTELGAAQFPGNRNKDPPFSPKNRLKKNHRALLEPNPLPQSEHSIDVTAENFLD